MRVLGEGAPVLGEGAPVLGEGAPVLGEGASLGEGAPVLGEGASAKILDQFNSVYYLVKTLSQLLQKPWFKQIQLSLLILRVTPVAALARFILAALTYTANFTSFRNYSSQKFRAF